MAVKETGAPLAELMGDLPADKTVADPWRLGGGVRSLGKVRCRTFMGESLATQGEKVAGGGRWWQTQPWGLEWPCAGRVQVGLLRVRAPLLASPCLLGPLGWWSAEVTRLSCPAGLPSHVHSLSSSFSPDPRLWPSSSFCCPAWGCDWSRPWVGTAGLATGLPPRRGQGQWEACIGAHLS